tara:strand:+ start:2128 stop:2619 length:492 start_codon:yes stop_codon:yes gene_type:complete
MKIKIGNGIDVHKLELGESLILGGVHIDSNHGIKGHSDGDLIIHALVDSILGALSIGDIGKYFPSTDEKWKNADSNIFLKFALDKMNNLEYKINNIDITVVLQSPSLQSYNQDIRNNLCSLCNINLDQISLKATTTDKLGFLGRKEGVAAFATTLLINNESKN